MNNGKHPLPSSSVLFSVYVPVVCRTIMSVRVAMCPISLMTQIQQCIPLTEIYYLDTKANKTMSVQIKSVTYAMGEGKGRWV